ncbi:MAG: DUF1294 domain-containing protein [Eubacteriales bacterium]|nr:DUF1294 domain-containing protein [Eubacteriales bacterium]
MDLFQHLGWYYVLMINILAFSVYGADKGKARRNHWRISEKTLIGLAVIGGSIGALLGMYVFRHKTQKRKFTVGIPCILVLQAAVGLFLFFYI